jgi:hypothetical protein
MSRQASIITLVVLFVVSVGSIGGYLLYAIPSSNADRLDRQLASLRGEQATLQAQLAAANRKADAASRRADAASELASTTKEQAEGAYARGREAGLQDGLAQAQTRYDQGYADGSASVFGRYAGDWANGAFYVVRVEGGRVVNRAALQQCLAVYAQGGSVWVQGPAC